MLHEVKEVKEVDLFLAEAWIFVSCVLFFGSKA